MPVPPLMFPDSDVLVKGQALFDQRMGVAMPYFLSGETHRGSWGIQGSRPVDALALWTLLQALETDQLRAAIDRNTQMTRCFHTIQNECRLVEPTHVPDLNLQVKSPPETEAQKQFNSVWPKTAVFVRACLLGVAKAICG